MKRFGILLVVPASLLLGGCLGDVMEIFCETGPDSDHCYQTAAVQESEPADCEKIAGEGFSGSNPPKDKCYLQIAENTGDPSVCDSIEGGFMSYSKEECLRNVLQTHGPDSCKDLESEKACRIAYARNGKGCGDGLAYKGGECVAEAASSSSSASFDHDDIESKVEGDLTSLKDAATGKYMELLEQAIESETDPDTLAGLQAYKEFLDQSGETLETVQTSVDKLKEIKRIFLDAYDPSMNVEHMPVDKILEKGLVDRISDKLFGPSPDTPRSQAEDALSVYDAMLKRQGEIDFLQKGRLSRLQDVVTSSVKDDLTGQVKDKAKDIAEGVAGTAFATVGIVDHALTSFQEAAQKEMFVGLAAAYARRRDAIAQSSPGLSPEEVHKRTVEQVKDDPYQDAVNSGFVKYGNLLENQDCQDGSNPLCIDNRVFWTAMDKTYRHQHK